MMAPSSVVVHAALDGHHERSGDSQLVKSCECPLANVAQVCTAQLHQRVAGKRIELKIDLETPA